MKRFMLAAALSLACGSLLIGAQGKGPENDKKPDPVHIPDSSIEQPGDNGLHAHTNHVITIRPQAAGATPSGLTPLQALAAYGLGTDLTSAGGAGTTIYIVDAFHYPTALSDFNTFSGQFGLPTEPSTNPTSANNKVFQVIYNTTGKRAPRTDCGWAQEAALDIEWAHAMAPAAKIVLVEAASNSFSNLMAAVDLADKDPSARQVSMSWGGSEFSSEASYDSHFNRPSNFIVYTAASGDTGGRTIYPGVSPYVIAAGGTRLNLDAGGHRIDETGWSGSGGGVSGYEPRPGYQTGLTAWSGNHRGVPDWSFDADPQTGVSVYDSTSCQGLVGWMVFGGTSVASPALAGILNRAGSNHADSTAALTTLYGNLPPSGLYGQNFFDILSGQAGAFSAGLNWDFVTGIGSTNGLGGK